MINGNLMSGVMGHLYGLRIFEDAKLTKTYQARLPKTRKRRILKKWAKRKENFRTVPDRNIYKTAHGIFCHPVVAAEIRRASI